MPGKHQHFQEPEVGCCGKYFLFGFNIVFWVSAGSALGPVLGLAEKEARSPARGDHSQSTQALGLGTAPYSFHPHASTRDHPTELPRGLDGRGAGPSYGRGGGVSRVTPEADRKSGGGVCLLGDP